MIYFIAPKIVGGAGRSWVAGPAVARMADALPLEEVEVSRIGPDILVTGRPAYGMAKPHRRR